MIGIILAGGTGSRLYPCTAVTNKHLLPVYNMPMICYPLQTLLNSGINDIIVVTGREHMGDVVRFLGSGDKFDCTFTYKVQDKPGGIAQALGLCCGVVGDENMAVILGDNIFNPYPMIPYNDGDDLGASLILTHHKNAERFGVAWIEHDKIVRIEEKPQNARGGWVITGVYLYDSSVFDYIGELIPSSRGELEISDVNRMYMKEGKLGYVKYKGFWSDAGTFDSLIKTQEELWKNHL
jgi:glucose-1-phosphate thymidylyltransferase